MSDAAPKAREADPSLGGQPLDQAGRAAQVEVITGPDVPTSDDVIEDMRRQLAELDEQAKANESEIARERAALRAAEQRARDAESRAQAADKQRRDAQQAGDRQTDAARLDAVGNALASHQEKMTSLKGQLAAAASEGEFTRVADLQAEMAILGGRIAQLEDGKAALEERAKHSPPATADASQIDQESIERRREAWIASQPPLVQTWLRGPNGTRFFADAQFQADVSAAARIAQREHMIDTQEYIDRVEELIGLRQPAQRQAAASATTPTSTGREVGEDRRIVAAPAGGATAGSVRTNARGVTEVYLTKDEMDMADRMEISYKDWATEKARLEREGLIGPGARQRG